MTLSSVFWVLFIFICISNFGTGMDLLNLLTRNENPYKYLTTDQVIAKFGYPSESHHIKTEDGYILELHRIPHGIKSNVTTKRLPVLLEHGLFGSSEDFILLGPNRSLAYLLADEGYDVWLGNFRGITYSRGHVTYVPLEVSFWDFSWHEMGIYDIPAQIDYICKYTNHDKLIYLGYSLGTTSFFVMSTKKPDYQSKVKGAVMLAPIAYMGKNIILGKQIIYNIVKFYMSLKKPFELREIFRADYSIQLSIATYCVSKTTTLCKKLHSLIDSEEKLSNVPEIPDYFNPKEPGISLKTYQHYFQLIESGKFRQFDYGLTENVKQYGNSSPPSYDLTKVNVSLYLYQAKYDYFVNMKAYGRLMNELPKAIGKVIDDYSFTHSSFLLDKAQLYNDVIANINDIESK